MDTERTHKKNLDTRPKFITQATQTRIQTELKPGGKPRLSRHVRTQIKLDSHGRRHPSRLVRKRLDKK